MEKDNIVKTEKDTKEKKLVLIPKAERYIEYMIDLILKLPRTEKFNIGNEYKKVMYEMLEYILFLSKLNNKECLYYINKIDALLNIQRILLRIMYKKQYIDKHRFDVSIEMIAEIGRIVGGLLKYYGKMVKK